MFTNEVAKSTPKRLSGDMNSISIHWDEAGVRSLGASPEAWQIICDALNHYAKFCEQASDYDGVNKRVSLHAKTLAEVVAKNFLR